MQKILPTGNLNVGDPFVRSIARILIPDIWGLILALFVFALFLFTTLRKQFQRKSKGLELDNNWTVWFQIIIFGIILISAVLTLNAYRSLPLLLVLLIAFTALLDWITRSTPYGRSLFAVGGNSESARRVGMKIKRIRVSAFAIVGLMAAIGGIFGAVIGGTSLFGVRGSVWNAILGALVIGSLGNGLDLSGASAADKLMVSGAILLLAVAIDALSRNSAGGR